MSIASELSALNGHIISAYDEISTMGGTVPQNKNMANLVSAIASIPSGGGGGDIVSGVIEYESDTNLNSFPNYYLAHNLGKEPKGICWFVLGATVSNGNVQAMKYGVLAHYVDETSCYKLTCYNTSSVSTSLNMRFSSSNNISEMFFIDEPHSEKMRLINPNFYTVASSVPAGSKIVWFIWG